MKEQVILFETAKLAKKKGFDWKVHLHYESNGNRFSNKIKCNFNNVELICSAPTQSLLQKWLREVHNIHLHICYFSETNNWNVDIYKLPDNDLLNNPMKFSKNKTYEEALEIGLQEALKLIK